MPLRLMTAHHAGNGTQADRDVLDGVHFTLETRAGHFVAHARVELDSDGSKTSGALEFRHYSDYRGRFANYLPKSLIVRARAAVVRDFSS